MKTVTSCLAMITDVKGGEHRTELRYCVCQRERYEYAWGDASFTAPLCVSLAVHAALHAVAGAVAFLALAPALLLLTLTPSPSLTLLALYSAW
jgi:hypothetical protein